MGTLIGIVIVIIGIVLYFVFRKKNIKTKGKAIYGSEKGKDEIEEK